MVCRSIFIFPCHFVSSIARDKSCLPMDEVKTSPKSVYARYRCRIVIFIVFLISAVILTTVFVIQSKHNFQSTVIHTSNTSIINEKHNVSDEKYVLKNIDEYFI